jgi:hypothetical protein
VEVSGEVDSRDVSLVFLQNLYKRNPSEENRLKL